MKFHPGSVDVLSDLTRSEDEPALQFHGATDQPTVVEVRQSEIRVRYRAGPAAGTNDSGIASKGKRRKIELVKRVVKIHAQLNLGALSNELHCWKPEGLLDTHVNRAVAGSAEAVAADRGKRRGTWRRQGSGDSAALQPGNITL